MDGVNYQKDIDIIYRRLNDSDQRLTRLESAKEVFHEVLKKNVELSEQLSTTLIDVKNTMLNLNAKIETQTDAMKAMENRFSDAHKEAYNQIKSLDDKIQQYDERSKFDIMLFLKHNWGWIMMLFGLGFYYASQFAKF